MLPCDLQIRNKWPDFRMKKDARKRNTLKEYGVYKLRYNALRKNNIIPLEIQVIKIEKNDCDVHIFGVLFNLGNSELLHF